MSRSGDADRAPLRAIAFGAADGSLWGAAIDRGPRALVIGSGSAAATGVAEGLRWEGEETGVWRLEGDGVRLAVEPLPVPTPAPDAPDGPGGPGAAYVPGRGPELCRVTGEIPGAGAPVDALGARVRMDPASSAKAVPSSARLVGGFFPDGAALAVLAARPGSRTEADADVATATLFDPDRWIAVTEPRLSTTYGPDGEPRRCSLELWIGEGEDEFPRRAAGEASADGAEARGDGVGLRVLPLRCHSRGEDGAGVYALATF